MLWSQGIGYNEGLGKRESELLDFGDVIYKIASNTLLNKLDAVYYSAIHYVAKAPYTTHHCDLYALVGWPSLHTRRQTQLATDYLQVSAR
jgi:hypothetical protein